MLYSKLNVVGSSSEDEQDDLEQPMGQIPLPTDTNWLSITQITYQDLLFLCLHFPIQININN